MANESVVLKGFLKDVGKREVAKFEKALNKHGYIIWGYEKTYSGFDVAGFIEVTILLEKDGEFYRCWSRWEDFKPVFLVRSIMQLVNMEIIKCDCTG